MPELTTEQAAFLSDFLTKLIEGKVCPRCNTPIIHKYQVGCCVYAAPCSCRLYCGVVDAEPEQVQVYGHNE